MSKDTYELLKELEESVVETAKQKILNSSFVCDQLEDMYKKGMSKLYSHVSETTGKFTLYVSPDDDTDTGENLDLQEELELFITHCDDDAALRFKKFIISLYDKRSVSDD